MFDWCLFLLFTLGSFCFLFFSLVLILLYLLFPVLNEAFICCNFRIEKECIWIRVKIYSHFFLFLSMCNCLIFIFVTDIALGMKYGIFTFLFLDALPILFNVSFIISKWAFCVNYFFCKAIFSMDPCLHIFQRYLANLWHLVASWFATVFFFLVFRHWFERYSGLVEVQVPSINLIIWCLTHSSWSCRL